MDDYYLEFWEIHPNDVLETQWAFCYHLLELHKQWTYLRRVLRIVLCENPDSKAIDVPFQALVDSTEWGESRQHRWACVVSHQFYEDTCAFLTSLAEATAALSPVAFEERLAIWDLTADEIAELRSRTQPTTDNRDDGRWQFHFFFAIGIAHAIVCKWDQKLNQLRNGETLLVWKQTAVRQGAASGGAKAAEIRRKSRRATSSEVRAHYAQLVAEGHSERNIAATLAKRLNVTPDHIRRLRREPEEKPT